MKLLCKVLGHRWEPVWTPRGRDKGAPIKVCLRCRENGWVIT
jgi:hypothetical protein